jgi:hypothetical protein
MSDGFGGKGGVKAKVGRKGRQRWRRWRWKFVDMWMAVSKTKFSSYKCPTWHSEVIRSQTEGVGIQMKAALILKLLAAKAEPEDFIYNFPSERLHKALMVSLRVLSITVLSASFLSFSSFIVAVNMFKPPES